MELLIEWANWLTSFKPLFNPWSPSIRWLEASNQFSVIKIVNQRKYLLDKALNIWNYVPCIGIEYLIPEKKKFSLVNAVLITTFLFFFFFYCLLVSWCRFLILLSWRCYFLFWQKRHLMMMETWSNQSNFQLTKLAMVCHRRWFIVNVIVPNFFIDLI